MASSRGRRRITNFAPSKAADREVALWRERAQRELAEALEIVRCHKWEKPEHEVDAQILSEHSEGLLASLPKLAQSGEGALICRIHGDFHLGQVLVAAGDVYIIDFEGQPSTPIAERRHKESPLRDTAGLLRSLDYAAATAAQGRGLSASTGNQEARRAFIARFHDATTSAFLSAYGERAARYGEALNEALLDLFMIEKSAYEIRYEAANRPAWLPIPLAGLAGLTRRLISRGVLHGER